MDREYKKLLVGFYDPLYSHNVLAAQPVRLFKQLFYDAALLGRLFQDLLVVEPDAQLFGQAQPNLAPAAAELPADANDQMLLHKSTASP